MPVVESVLCLFVHLLGTFLVRRGGTSTRTVVGATRARRRSATFRSTTSRASTPVRALSVAYRQPYSTAGPAAALYCYPSAGPQSTARRIAVAATVLSTAGSSAPLLCSALRRRMALLPIGSGRTSVEEKLAAWREPKSEADVAHVRACGNAAMPRRGYRRMPPDAAGWRGYSEYRRREQCGTPPVPRVPAAVQSTVRFGLRSLASCRVACVSQQHGVPRRPHSGCMRWSGSGSGWFARYR